jgi:hypothetical protein
MSRFLPLYLASALAFSTSSAAAEKVPRPDPQQLVLGTTSQEAVVKQYGQPVEVLDLDIAGHKVEMLSYTAFREGESAVDGAAAARVAYFYFTDEKLIGYEFSSADKHDATYFKRSQAERVKQGMTRDELVKVMGQPSGMYRYPLIPEKDADGLVYFFFEDRNFHFHKRMLLAVADPMGNIVRTSFKVEGESPTD